VSALLITSMMPLLLRPHGDSAEAGVDASWHSTAGVVGATLVADSFAVEAPSDADATAGAAVGAAGDDGSGGPPRHMLPGRVAVAVARGSSSSSDCSVLPTRMTAPFTRMTLAPVATSVATSIDGIPIVIIVEDEAEADDDSQLVGSIIGWNTRKQVNMTNIMPPSRRPLGTPLWLLPLAAAAAAAANPDDSDMERELSSKFDICKCGGN